MKYILKYKNKEDFIEDNPKKEKIDLPVVLCYPEERTYEWRQRGEPEDELYGSSDWIYSFFESGKTGTSIEISPEFDYDTKTDIFYPMVISYDVYCEDSTEGSCTNFKQPLSGTPGQLRIQAYYNDTFVGDFPLIELDTWVIEEEYGDSTHKEYYGAYTWENGTVISAKTRYEEYLNTGTENVLMHLEYNFFNFDEMEDEDYWDSFIYTVPSSGPTAYYGAIGKVTAYDGDYRDQIYKREYMIPAAIAESSSTDDFLVKKCLLFIHDDITSCGFTVSKNDWFGYYRPSNGENRSASNANSLKPNLNAVEDTDTGTTSTKSRVFGSKNPTRMRGRNAANLKFGGSKDLILGESSVSSDFVLRKFYTEGETGMTELLFYDYKHNVAAVIRCYYTVFYLDGGNDKTPYYALTRYHRSQAWGYVYDHIHEKYFKLYGAIKDVSEEREEGQIVDCESFAGEITILGNPSPTPEKEGVTKIAPGFAYVKNPVSVYYNELGSDTPYEPVIPGSDTDAPGSNPLVDESGTGFD